MSTRNRRAFWLHLALVTVLSAACACGAALTREQAAHMRNELREAMRASVPSRSVRDEHSRLLADVVGHDALHGLDREEVRAAFGPGEACRNELCRSQGFDEGDWYYEIGRAEGREVKQLPVLIVGFDPQGRAARIYTLTTH